MFEQIQYTGYDHLGCYTDTAIRAANDYIQMVNNSNRVEECFILCIEYKYFALEDGILCLCENSFKQATQYGISNNCFEGIGGIWSIDLYKNNECMLIYLYITS